MQEYEETNDVEDPVVEGNENSVTEEVAEPQESDKEYNFRALREKAERLEREKQELDERTRRYEQMLMERQQPKENSQPDEDDNFDFSDAVDSDAFAKLSKKLERQERKLQEKLDRLELANKQQSLASKDPGYIDVINNYLPAVIKENPGIKDIISKAPLSEQYDLMYRFATTNKDYVVNKYVDKAKKENRIEEEKPRINTLGAMQSGRANVNSTSALEMNANDFYGEDGYLRKILEGKIK